MRLCVDTTRFARTKRAPASHQAQISRRAGQTSMNTLHPVHCAASASRGSRRDPEMGATGSGEDMEITTDLQHDADVGTARQSRRHLPVGAPELKPYAFCGGQWELGKTQSIERHGRRGSAIRVDTRGREVCACAAHQRGRERRSWISDKTRHVVDGCAPAPRPALYP